MQHNSSITTIKNPITRNKNQQTKIPTPNPKEKLINLSKEQKLNIFGSKSITKANNLQTENPSTTIKPIQPTLKRLNETQKNEYFRDKLNTKLTENIEIVNLNINGLDLGHGEIIFLQRCLNL